MDGRFIACFHLDLDSSQTKASALLLDTGIYFQSASNSTRRKAAKVQLPVQLMKIHYNSMEGEIKASTLDQMGSLSHQIAIVFEEGLAYLLNPNHLKATVVYPPDHQHLQNGNDDALEMNEKDESAKDKETEKNGNTPAIGALPYLCLTLEKNNPFVTLRIYPDTSAVKKKDSEPQNRDWSSCMLDLQKELTLWLSILTDISLGSLVQKRKRRHSSILEKRINTTSQLHDNQDLSSFPISSNRPQRYSPSTAPASSTSPSCKDQMERGHSDALEQAVCLIDDMHHNLLSFLKVQQQQQQLRDPSSSSKRKKAIQDHLVYPSLERLSSLVTETEMKKENVKRLPNLSDFTGLARRTVDLGFESPLISSIIDLNHHFQQKVNGLWAGVNRGEE